MFSCLFPGKNRSFHGEKHMVSFWRGAMFVPVVISKAGDREVRKDLLPVLKE